MSLPPELAAIVARLSAGGRPEEIPPTTLPSEREEMLDQIAAAGARDPRVLSVARGLYAKIAERLGRAPTRAELVQWIMDSVHLLCDYVPDPAGREVFQSVQWTLGGRCGSEVSPLSGEQKGCADCEDQAALLVALCLALGIRARVRWIDQPGYPLNHVSAQVLFDDARPGDPKAWLCTDATIPGARPGDSPEQALDRVGPGFRSRVFGLENAAGGIFKQAGFPATRQRFRSAGLPSARLTIFALPSAGVAVEVDGALAEGTRNGAGDWFTMVEPGPHNVRVVGLGGVREGMVDASGSGGGVVFSTLPLVPAVRAPTSSLAERLAPLLALREAEAAQWPDYARYLGYRIDGETEVPELGAAHFEYVTDPSRDRALARTVTGDDRFDYGLGVEVGTLRTAVSVGYILERPPSVPGIADDVPRGTMVDIGVDRVAATAIPGTAGGGVEHVEDLRDLHDVAVADRYWVLRNIDDLTRQIRFQRAATFVAPVGTPVGAPPAPVRTLYVVGIPPGSTIALGGVNLDVTMGRFVPGGFILSIPPAIPSAMQSVRIVPPTGVVHTGAVTVAANGQTNINFSALRVAPAELRIQGMVPGGIVSLNGAVLDNRTGRPEDGYTTWVLPVPSELTGPRVNVKITPPSGPSRERTIAIAVSGPTNLRYADTAAPPAPPAPPAPTPSSIEVANIPPGSRLFVDGVDVSESGRWVDRTTFGVPAAPGTRALRVHPPTGSDRTATGLAVPVGGAFTVEWGRMVPVAPVAPADPLPADPLPVDPVAPDGTPPPRTGRVVVRGAPAGISPARIVAPGAVAYNPATSQPLTAQEGGYLAVTWAVGPARLQVGEFDVPVTVMLGVDSVYDYTPTGLVFRPLVSDARVAPLPGQTPPTPGTTGANPVTLELRALAGETEREVVLTDAMGRTLAMTSGQYPEPSEAPSLPGGPPRPPRSTAPDYWSASVTPGPYGVRATSLVGRVRTARVEVGTSAVSYNMSDLLWSVSDQGAALLTGIPHDTATGLDAAVGALLGTGARYVAELTHAPASDNTTLRPLSNGDLAGYATPGRYTLTVYLETSPVGAVATRRAVKTASVDLVADHLSTIAYGDMTDVAVDGSTATVPVSVTPVDAAHSRLTIAGLGDGWAATVDGSARQPAEGLTRGRHTIELRNPTTGLSAVREVVLTGPAETVDVAYDIARAMQFAAGRDGVVNVTEQGLRNGYPAALTVANNRTLGWLTPAEERKVMREFDVVGAWRDRGGKGGAERMPVALFYKGQGMVVVPLTAQELRHIASNLVVRRGKIGKSGYYPIEYMLSAPAA